ncbi:MAG: methyltetrahydrofolate cobalamin methyltransferase [Oscillospiraceae bacterium]|jgi:5-methyltetrahydrofolate--homocysteine methyltransferase|nr:methyltetrahydrofolate cobalamin methyltransferase [Oscillospiraceae bacterium]
MIIIGEKINGAIPSSAKAIAERDADFIRGLAIRQTDAGADYLDICAGTAPELERDTFEWLLDIVQEAVDTPLCIDSPDPEILRDILPLVKRPGIINSVSGEGSKCEIIYPLIAETEWNVVALTCDDAGIPADAERKVAIGLQLIEKAATYGITPDRIFIDPLVLSVSAVNDALINFNEAIRQIKAKYPTVHFTSGLSNISFGMPKRKLINQNFLAFASQAGMDSAIMDPTDTVMFAEILAVDALLGRDKFCRAYNKAFRQGKLG